MAAAAARGTDLTAVTAKRTTATPPDAARPIRIAMTEPTRAVATTPRRRTERRSKATVESRPGTPVRRIRTTATPPARRRDQVPSQRSTPERTAKPRIASRHRLTTTRLRTRTRRRRGAAPDRRNVARPTTRARVVTVRTPRRPGVTVPKTTARIPSLMTTTARTATLAGTPRAVAGRKAAKGTRARTETPATTDQTPPERMAPIPTATDLTRTIPTPGRAAIDATGRVRPTRTVTTRREERPPAGRTAVTMAIRAAVVSRAARAFPAAATDRPAPPTRSREAGAILRTAPVPVTTAAPVRGAIVATRIRGADRTRATGADRTRATAHHPVGPLQIVPVGPVRVTDLRIVAVRLLAPTAATVPVPIPAPILARAVRTVTADRPPRRAPAPAARTGPGRAQGATEEPGQPVTAETVLPEIHRDRVPVAPRGLRRCRPVYDDTVYSLDHVRDHGARRARTLLEPQAVVRA